MQKTITIASGAVALLLAATAAHAELKADTNGDGQISRAEAEAAAAMRFNRADRNGDGFLTPDEMRAGRADQKDRMQQRPVNRPVRFDFDGDGKVSRDEFMRGAQDARVADLAEQMFREMDTNGDGFLSESERKAAMENIRRGTDSR